MDEPVKPDHLGTQGSAFWDQIVKDHKFDAAGYALIENICRTIDIINKLNAALGSRHQEWVKLVEDSEFVDLDRDTTEVKVQVVVNPLLQEVRQQRLALRQLIAHLHIGKVAGSQAAPTSNFWEGMETAYANS